jgi:hypothetical protein
VTVLNVLAPVFLLILLGGVLQRSGFVSAQFLREANRVTYWLGLPALLFNSLATSLHSAEGAKGLLFTLLLSTAAVLAISYLVGLAVGVKMTALGTFVQGAFRGNLAFVGLPIVYSLPDVVRADGLSLRAAVVLALAPMLVLYNVLGVVVLLISQHSGGWKMWKPVAKQLATTPPLLASLAGILYALAGWTLPISVSTAFDWLGQMALPLALLGIGGALVQVRLGQAWLTPVTAGLIKSFVSPAAGYAIGIWLGLNGAELRSAAILLATPTAAVSYTMVSQMKGDESLASGAILFSTLLSLVSLGLILSWA